jgi:hypothetical protein
MISYVYSSLRNGWWSVLQGTMLIGLKLPQNAPTWVARPGSSSAGRPGAPAAPANGGSALPAKKRAIQEGVAGQSLISFQDTQHVEPLENLTVMA